MLKVRLELDTLQVESFATSNETVQWRGTVEGLSRRRAVSYSCYGTCFEATCADGSCPNSCASCDTVCVSCDTVCGGGGGTNDSDCTCPTITQEP
jgi:hypothetical protein